MKTRLGQNLTALRRNRTIAWNRYDAHRTSATHALYLEACRKLQEAEGTPVNPLATPTPGGADA